MRYSEFRHLVASDLFRYQGRRGARVFFHCMRHEPGFKYSFWMRLCRYSRENPLLRWGPYHLARALLSRYQFKFGVFIDPATEIGPGFYIGHVGSIVVNRRCRIGRNCNISHEVTLGYKSRGEKEGCPVIGSNVYIAPGAKVIGAVRVGDHAAIGANSVVTGDVPEHGVAAGIPATIISDKGSAGYVNHTVD